MIEVSIRKQISEKRTQIMGIASIGVLFVHSVNIIVWPPALAKLFGFGGIGVYIFVFLSAVGLFGSLKYSGGGGYSKSDFYRRRFSRLIIPYCLIAGTWYGIFDLLVKREPVLFLYDISTFSFWLEHKGAWYVAMLIPVYILFPWFYDWVEAKNKKIKLLGSFCFNAGIGLILSINAPELYAHLGQVIASLIVYIIGYYYAGLEAENNASELILGAICLLLFVLKTVTPLKNNAFVSGLSWGMLGIPTMFIAGLMLSMIKCKIVDTILIFIGKRSLEVYLWNIFLIRAMKEFDVFAILKNKGDVYGFVSYGIILVLGLLLSYIYGKAATNIAHRTVSK